MTAKKRRRGVRRKKATRRRARPRSALGDKAKGSVSSSLRLLKRVSSNAEKVGRLSQDVAELAIEAQEWIDAVDFDIVQGADSLGRELDTLDDRARDLEAWGARLQSRENELLAREAELSRRERDVEAAEKSLVSRLSGGLRQEPAAKKPARKKATRGGRPRGRSGAG